MAQLQSIKYKDRCLEILDQLLLPKQCVYVPIKNVNDGWFAIRNMQVRGAPAIAIVGCLSLAVDIAERDFTDKNQLLQEVSDKLNYLVTSRPTAVNIKTAREELVAVATGLSKCDGLAVEAMKTMIIDTIEKMLEDDLNVNKRIGENGAYEILAHCLSVQKVRVLTHCNTGSLATAGYGTALGVIRSLHRQNRLEQVYCTETRPYNQGARLTTYELLHDNIPATLITDSMVAALMKEKKINAVVVGADRIAANGDTANKIGTYQIAILAKYHNIPFYIAAPFSTVDPNISTGDNIVIEERPPKELTHIGDQQITPDGVTCWNPAFDVTPGSIISGIITEERVYLISDFERRIKQNTNVKK